jgi:uncharacterized protein YegP (UPF0339 family)
MGLMDFEPRSGRRGAAHPRQRESAGTHFRKLDGGSLAAGPAAVDTESNRQPRSDAPCRFEIYRADEVRLTAIRLSGGDWHWRLSDADGKSLVEAGGYRTEDECREAIHTLRNRAALATMPGGG